MSSIVSTLKGIFSGDTLFLVIVFALFLGYALYMGRGRMTSLLFAFYPAALLYNGFPFINKFLVLHGDKMIALNKVGIFLILLVPISLIIDRAVMPESLHMGMSRFFRLAGLALCATVFVLIFAYSMASLDALHDFSPKIDTLFTGMDKLFYWNLGILAILALV